MTDIDKVAWVLIRDGSLLVARNRGRDLFYLPGGRREAGESDADTLVREVREELAVDVDPTTMRLVTQVRAPRHGAAGEVRMTCYTAAYTGEPVPSAEIAELAWVTTSDGDLVTVAERQVIDHLVAAGDLPLPGSAVRRPPSGASPSATWRSDGRG